MNDEWRFGFMTSNWCHDDVKPMLLIFGETWCFLASSDESNLVKNEYLCKFEKHKNLRKRLVRIFCSFFFGVVAPFFGVITEFSCLSMATIQINKEEAIMPKKVPELCT